MDTAESQANGHTSAALCCPPLQSRATPAAQKAGAGCFLPARRGWASSWEAVAKDSSML